MNDTKDKIDKMIEIAVIRGVNIEDIYFVDDMFSLVLDASVLGIDAHHISGFLET